MKMIKPKGTTPLNWRKTLLVLALAMGAIGAWIFQLASLAISTYTRDSIVLFMPTNRTMLVGTFFMLTGLVFMAIQIVNILEHFIGTNETHSEPSGSKH